MSFLRRISHAILPQVPSAQGIPATHVPRRATETYGKARISDEHLDKRHSVASRASWELSSDGISSASSSDAETDDSDRSSLSDDDDDSEEEYIERRPKDKYDVMARHLWGTADRMGWFRDADYDGLVSIR